MYDINYADSHLQCRDIDFQEERWIFMRRIFGLVCVGEGWWILNNNKLEGGEQLNRWWREREVHKVKEVWLGYVIHMHNNTMPKSGLIQAIKRTGYQGNSGSRMLRKICSGWVKGIGEDLR